MVNFLGSNPGTRLAVLIYLATLILPSSTHASAPRYKSQTIVDFDAATVEGKTRRPYSSLVTQKAGQEPQYLFSWKPNWQQRYRDAANNWSYQQ